MSDETSSVVREARKDWVTEHREMYLRSGGTQGHIEDLTPVGGRTFGYHLLIKHVGRKSGKVFIVPLSYGAIGGEVVIVGSKGGADNHPEWYLNLHAGSPLSFQIATQAYNATWREPEGAERQKVWDYMVDCYPFYAQYQASTDRQIPLVLMKGVESIPVFKESDATGLRKL
jgi:deazaflavin-dependent oxidoreductase (nitroreductase family)